AQPVVRRHRQRHARIDARELFDADAVVQRRHPGAAVLLGELDAEQAERGELRHQLAGKVLLLVPLAHVRPHLRLRELADAAPQQILLFGKPEVHQRIRIARGQSVASDAGQSPLLTVATTSAYVLRAVFCTHARRDPSVDQAGSNACFAPETACLWRSRLNRNNRPSRSVNAIAPLPAGPQPNISPGTGAALTNSLIVSPSSCS